MTATPQAFCFKASVMWEAERGKVSKEVPESIRAPPRPCENAFPKQELLEC